MVAEQVEPTQKAYEADTAIIHRHVRDDESRPISGPERFTRLEEAIEHHCPGMVVQSSIGGREARRGWLDGPPFRPDGSA